MSLWLWGSVWSIQNREKKGVWNIKNGETGPIKYGIEKNGLKRYKNKETNDSYQPLVNVTFWNSREVISTIIDYCDVT